jgi:hypothetical protein
LATGLHVQQLQKLIQTYFGAMRHTNERYGTTKKSNLEALASRGSATGKAVKTGHCYSYLLLGAATRLARIKNLRPGSFI